MTASITETRTLTKDDVKALRQADQIVLRIFEGKSTLEALLDRGWSDSPRIFTAVEQRLFPEVDTALGGRMRVIEVTGTINGYNSEEDRVQYHLDSTRAFEMIHSAKYSQEWQTIAHLALPGDQVRLLFNADGHSNEITRKAGLHVDTASIVLTRGKRVMRLHVSTRVGYDNTARMIQRRG